MDLTGRYGYFLFDLDGTITDPGVGITNSVMYALEKFNITEKDRSKLYKFIGPPLRESFSKYYGFSREDSEKAVEYYREYYREKGIFECELYGDVAQTLRKLKEAGKKVVLATSKPEMFARRILDYFEISEYFDFAAGSTLDGSRDKKADVIAYALKEAGCFDAKNALMIGDREHDIIGAKANGMDSVGVLYGYGDRVEHENAGATYIIAKITELV